MFLHALTTLVRIGVITTEHERLGDSIKYVHINVKVSWFNLNISNILLTLEQPHQCLKSLISAHYKLQLVVFRKTNARNKEK